MRKTASLALIMIAALFAPMVTIPVAPAAAQLATNTPLPVPTATPSGPTPIPPLVTPLPAAAGCTQPLNFNVGDLVAVRSGVAVRNLPTTSGAQVGYYNENIVMRITGGPVCGSGYNWWPVAGYGNPGWVAERTPQGGFFLSLVESADASTRCTVPLDVNVDDRIFLNNGLRVREVAGTDGRVLTVAPSNTLAIVTGGPVCSSDFNWWQIRVMVYGITYSGWVAEGVEGEYWFSTERALIELAQGECAPPYRRLSVGIRAVLITGSTTPKNLRAQPDPNAAVLATLIDNVGFDIIGGPVCAGGQNWWQVRVLSGPPLEGWLAEGARWIRPLTLN